MLNLTALEMVTRIVLFRRRCLPTGWIRSSCLQADGRNPDGRNPTWSAFLIPYALTPRTKFQILVHFKVFSRRTNPVGTKSMQIRLSFWVPLTMILVAAKVNCSKDDLCSTILLCNRLLRVNNFSKKIPPPLLRSIAINYFVKTIAPSFNKRWSDMCPWRLYLGMCVGNN